jgi:YbgC/YbaW family acyl-CoA thioester hydrolase
MEYCMRRRAQFAETDAAGLVHFTAYFRYMEEAEHALWREAGLTIFSPDADVAWPRAAASFEFKRALRFEEEFEVWIRVTAVTARTIQYRCTIVRDAEEVAVGHLRVVCVRRRPEAPLRAVDIPPEIAARFREPPADD